VTICACNFLIPSVTSSKMSLKYADEARATVLSFFNAPPSQYTVVFTQNASAALKLVGEAYPFAEETTYVLGSDSHNSVHGIREFARKAGAEVAYIPSTPTGGFDPAIGKVQYLWCRQKGLGLTPSIRVCSRNICTKRRGPYSQ